MKKHFNLLLAFFKVSLIAEMEFRFNMVLKIVADVVWYVAQLSIFEILFLHSTHYADWDLPSVRVFLGILFFTDVFYMLFFSENLSRVSTMVRNGELDLLLAKPVNALFMVSFRKIDIGYFLNLIIVVGYLFWAINKLPIDLTAWNILWFCLMAPASLVVSYSVRVFFASLSIIFVNAEGVSYLWYSLYRLGTRPDSIYPTALRYLILTVLPVAFLASVPSRFLLGKQESWMYWEVPLVCFLLFFGCIRFWNYSLKKYSSASS
ncbi:MAG: ABC-2 family transporter protein [Pseudomonadota bacterium]|nr:ABC-2 family transporter protein [Pseudomonadota bacterium]